MFVFDTGVNEKDVSAIFTNLAIGKTPLRDRLPFQNTNKFPCYSGRQIQWCSNLFW